MTCQHKQGLLCNTAAVVEHMCSTFTPSSQMQSILTNDAGDALFELCVLQIKFEWDIDFSFDVEKGSSLLQSGRNSSGKCLRK